MFECELPRVERGSEEGEIQSTDGLEDQKHPLCQQLGQGDREAEGARGENFHHSRKQRHPIYPGQTKFS